MQLFKCIRDNNLIEEYADALDFIFSDPKFDPALWDNKNKVQGFTKGLHRLSGWNDSTVHYDALKDTVFPSVGSWKSIPVPSVYMNHGNSEGRDFLRHLRNGIAHGRNDVYSRDGKLYLELLDYSDSSCEKQTTYILIPLSYLFDVYKLYITKEKQWRKQINSVPKQQCCRLPQFLHPVNRNINLILLY